jgi:hypothetical protein
MIENLRKYTGLIIVLFVLVLIGFLFMDTSTMRSGGGGRPYIKVEGRTYTDKEFSNLGASAYQLTQSLAQSGDFPLYSFLFGMSGDAQSQDKAMENFFANRMLLRSAKEEFGIYPGEEEIDSFIRKLRAFTGPNGEFSQEAYRNFIEKGIGRLGLTEGDIRALASDVIAPSSPRSSAPASPQTAMRSPRTPPSTANASPLTSRASTSTPSRKKSTPRKRRSRPIGIPSRTPSRPPKNANTPI